MPRPRARVLLVLPFALGLALGCGPRDDIETRDLPKSTETTKAPPPPEPEPVVGEYRILGAMFPADAPEWFFKMPGPADALTKYEADFDKMLASVSLPLNGPPQFTPPEGWKRGPGRGQFVAATVKTPDGKYEVTITSSRGEVEANLRRWSVDQLGNAKFEAGDVAKVTKPVAAKGVKGLRADLRGPTNPTGKGGPFMGGGK